MNMEKLLLQDDLDKRQFEILENSILEKPEFVSSLNEIMQINDAANYIKTAYIHPSAYLEEDCTILTLQVGVDADLIAWIRSWGTSIEVEAPLELKKAVDGCSSGIMFSLNSESINDKNSHKVPKPPC